MKQLVNTILLHMNRQGIALISNSGCKPWVFAIVCGMGLWGCSDFVEVDPPKNILVSDTVFEDPATVRSALAHIYYQVREQGMVSGNAGLTTGLGIYSDELDYYASSDSFLELYQHNVLASNTTLLGWWSSAYGIIYGANDIINGVGASMVLTDGDKDRFKGQALFVRGYMHSLLTSLFGDVPYIKTTSYRENNVVERLSVPAVHEAIISDLEEAIRLLDGDGALSELRVVPDLYVAKALLSRMYLYTENWDAAEAMASEVIGHFDLEPDVHQVFLKESNETIWQLSAGDIIRNTHEATQLIIQSVPGQSYALTESLLETFEAGDQRFEEWTESISNADSTVTLRYAHKYKANFTETESLEYSVIFRLAEQYLIRAEARARTGDVSGARNDVNRIRNRAGLDASTANTASELMEAIDQERRVELFAEQGHRWFDLKRSERAGEVLSELKPGWRPTDIWLPVPEMELQANPNLQPQNPGY